MRGVFLYLILVTILSGCGVSSSTDPVIISTVQAEMQLDLANPLKAPTQFAFRMSTLEEKCADAQILADGAIQGNNVHIAVSGLLVEPYCPGDLTKTEKDVYLDLEPGEYNLSMAIGEDLFNTGILSFDGDTYTMNIQSPLGIKIGHSELNRIPEGIIWGSISGEQNISEVRDMFLAAIQPITSESALKEGYYGHFTIYDSDILNVSLVDDDVYDFNHLFVYHLDGNTNGLQFALDNFRDSHGDEIIISCMTWKGESL